MNQPNASYAGIIKKPYSVFNTYLNSQQEPVLSGFYCIGNGMTFCCSDVFRSYQHHQRLDALGLLKRHFPALGRGTYLL